jgi:hypothetical protein
MIGDEFWRYDGTRVKPASLPRKKPLTACQPELYVAAPEWSRERDHDRRDVNRL